MSSILLKSPYPTKDILPDITRKRINELEIQLEERDDKIKSLEFQIQDLRERLEYFKKTLSKKI